METDINYTDREKAVISSDEQKWHRRIRVLKEQYPDQVTIKSEPETNDGNMVAEIPVEWVKPKKIGPGPKRNLTEEQKAEAAERLKAARLKGKETNETDDEA